MRALALPLQRLAATFGAGVDGFGFGHLGSPFFRLVSGDAVLLTKYLGRHSSSFEIQAQRTSNRVYLGTKSAQLHHLANQVLINVVEISHWKIILFLYTGYPFSSTANYLLAFLGAVIIFS